MRLSKRDLLPSEEYWLEVFQDKYPLGSFDRAIVEAFRKADLENLRRLKKGFPEIYRGFELWKSGEYS